MREQDLTEIRLCKRAQTTLPDQSERCFTDDLLQRDSTTGEPGVSVAA